jgi:hypothetical protein
LPLLFVAGPSAAAAPDAPQDMRDREDASLQPPGSPHAVWNRVLARLAAPAAPIALAELGRLLNVPPGKVLGEHFLVWKAAVPDEDRWIIATVKRTGCEELGFGSPTTGTCPAGRKAFTLTLFTEPARTQSLNDNDFVDADCPTVDGVVRRMGASGWRFRPVPPSPPGSIPEIMWSYLDRRGATIQIWPAYWNREDLNCLFRLDAAWVEAEGGRRASRR